jgi:hypothetical protein
MMAGRNVPLYRLSRGKSGTSIRDGLIIGHSTKPTASRWVMMIIIGVNPNDSF